jgi:hypothetical protein
MPDLCWGNRRKNDSLKRRKEMNEVVKYDSFSKNDMKNKVNCYINDRKITDDINSKRNKYINKFNLPRNKCSKICRHSNFPSEISENIVKFYLWDKKYPVEWRKGYDLCLKGLRIEVKAFASDGPISFGPNERWNVIYFVDCRNFTENIYTIYLIPYANTHELWRTLHINSNKTFSEMCDTGKRPRAGWDVLKKHFKNHIIVVHRKLKRVSRVSENKKR